jgi:site-specific DNA-methyltransferase (adenine-specific)/modification methylase
LHPTQKPVALFEYLIRTYTQPGELVFDPTCGSGTTAVAALHTGRRYIVGDTDAGYCEIARKRLAEPYTPSFLDAIEAVEYA